MKYYKAMKLSNLSVEDICAKIEMCVETFEDFVIDHEEHITAINAMKTTWSAGNNNRFIKSKASDVRKTLGTIVDKDWQVEIPEARMSPEYFVELPTNFDSRENWAKCTEIGKVRD
jgi:hypothetical protein